MRIEDKIRVCLPNGLDQDLVYLDYEDNTIYFYSDISTESTFKLKKCIIELNKKIITENTSLHYSSHKKTKSTSDIKNERIYLHINSPGGCATSSFNLADFIKKNVIKINTVVEGIAASGGSVLSVCGHERFIQENSLFMIHQVSSGLGGRLSEIEDRVENIKLIQKIMEGIYIKNSRGRLNQEKLKELIMNEKDLTALEAVQYGFCDEII